MADAAIIVGLDPFKPACPQCSWIDTNLGRQLDKLCALHQGIEDLRADLLLERQINRSTSSTLAELAKVLGANDDENLVERMKDRIAEVEWADCCGRPIHDGDPEGYVLACCGRTASKTSGVSQND